MTNQTLRSKLIRLAHARPDLRADLLPILKEAARTKREWVDVPRDVRIRGYGIFYAGKYLVEMPVDYDPDLVTAEGIVMDGAMRVVRER